MSADVSKSHEPLSACLGKVRFDSFNAASKVNDRTRKVRLRREVYRCNECGGFHLGNGMK